MGFDAAELGSIVSVYLSLAAVGAIYAGFAGVIIVFGLTPTSNLFRTFRQNAGERMVANWRSVISTAFLASSLSIASAALESLNYREAGSYVFEVGVLLLFHSAFRSLWILGVLLILVKHDDTRELHQQRTRTLGNFNHP